MTSTDIHGVIKVIVSHREFGEPFSFHTTRLLCVTDDGEHTVTLYSKKKPPLEEAE